jgi:hypothetical protein
MPSRKFPDQPPTPGRADAIEGRRAGVRAAGLGCAGWSDVDEDGRPDGESGGFVLRGAPVTGDPGGQDVLAGPGVSVETVHDQGPKRALLLGAFEQAFDGTEGPQLVTEQQVGLDILKADSIDELLRRVVDCVAAANARTSGLVRAFNAAAERDPHVCAAIEDLFARRRRDMTATISAFEDRGARITDPEQRPPVPRSTEDSAKLVRTPRYVRDAQDGPAPGRPAPRRGRSDERERRG